ncbi:toll/interleukin-1 receptor domain-containing protein [Actinoplanes sp. NPDC049681]|uniref:toll/interleukin-1 receptor domain-containing protein n=1 Tax=Actinoplanes sp. NPDC049681 TaxID=3363905 RepID=UPI0037BCD624
MSDTARAERLIAEMATQPHGDQQVRLARAVCMAIFVEPGLLRRARLDLVPGADLGTESDLYFGPLVQTRNVTGVVLDPEVLVVLRRQLAQGVAGPGFVRRSRELITRLHHRYPSALRTEEEIVWLSVADPPGATERMESLLHRAVRTMVMDPHQGREVARWAAQAWGRLPESSRRTEAARHLAVGSSLRTGSVIGAALPGAAGLPDGTRWLAPQNLPTVEVGITAHGDGLKIVAPSARGALVVRLPRTVPLVLEVSWQAAGERRREVVNAGTVSVLPLPRGWRDLALQTLDGRRYAIRPQGAPVDKWARSNSIFISHTGADKPWADWIQWQLQREGWKTSSGSDLTPGENWQRRLRELQQDAHVILTVVSAAFAASTSGIPEEDRESLLGRLIPVRIDETPLLGPLTARQALNLSGLDEQAARHALLNAVGPAPVTKASRPAARKARPPFPGPRGPVDLDADAERPLLTGDPSTSPTWIDLEIVRLIADHFAQNCRVYPSGGRAVDLSSGPNLYSPLTMLPFAEEVDLWERTAPRRRWLEYSIQHSPRELQDYWQVIRGAHPVYAAVLDFRSALRKGARIMMGDALTLPRGLYNVGTMMFVAETTADTSREFRRAVAAFLGSLRRLAPFAMAFLKDGLLYGDPGGRPQVFPIDERDVRRSLQGIAHDVRIYTVGGAQDATGPQVVVAMGRAGKK